MKFFVIVLCSGFTKLDQGEGASPDFLTPPIKTDTPMGSPKNKCPLKSEAPFQEMILEKKPRKIRNCHQYCDSFTHKTTLEKDDRYSTKT